MSEHDDFCEAEYVNGAGGYTSCSCDYRRTRGLVAERDRQVAERAWDECATKAQDLGRLDETAVPWLRSQSPYRTEEESNG